MLLISHRGNIDSIIPDRENTQSYIDEAIKAGYDVEIDVWYIKDQIFLGHDNPEILIDIEWLLERKHKLWIHCKNFMALTYLLKTDLRVFYHQKEAYTILSNKLIWAHELSNIDKNCIIPLLSIEEVNSWQQAEVYAICSDYVKQCKERFIE